MGKGKRMIAALLSVLFSITCAVGCEWQWSSLDFGSERLTVSCTSSTEGENEGGEWAEKENSKEQETETTDPEDEEVKRSYDLYEYLKPIWDTDTVYNETFMFLGEEDEAPFLYEPIEILGVKNYCLDKEYIEGKDYTVENGKLKRLKGGGIPYYTPGQYYTTEPGHYGILVDKEKIAYELDGTRYLLYGEMDTFTRNQVAVTYKVASEWTGKIPQGKSERLNGFIRKLTNGESLALTFYGDSIMTGCNASGTPMGGNVPPYMDPFPIMITEYLIERFDVKIEMKNVSQGGWNTYEGLAAYDERVLPTSPDLLVLGFGMNDLHTPLEEYKAMTEEMILRLRRLNPNAEIVLVATMWPHVESTWVLNQVRTLDKLLELEEKYPFVAVADMTTMHADIMAAGKRYRDMTANNINHPNDFLGRVYAQVILKTILGDRF